MTGDSARACDNLDDELDRLRGEGWRLDVVYPADDPHSAVLSRGDDQLRVTTRPDAPAPSLTLPPFVPATILTQALSSGGAGRAGMLYRDLIPGRLGGRYIASHIQVAEGGLVADWVHYHHVAVQLICVTQGWVRVVYEGQGNPFVMSPGDVVVQPPGIRHRVLESSAGLSVVEIGCPALHETIADHDLALPSAAAEPGRIFGGQGFVHHVAADAVWVPFAGGEAQETAVSDVTGGLADVRTIRPAGSGELNFAAHGGELVFGFVRSGSAMLEGDRLGASDSFVIPPHQAWRLADVSADFLLLHVTTARMPAQLTAEIA